jgi:hypothetical protein
MPLLSPRPCLLLPLPDGSFLDCRSRTLKRRLLLPLSLDRHQTAPAVLLLLLQAKDKRW